MDRFGQLVTKLAANPNPDYGCVPEQRSLDKRIEAGLIILDKPAGLTSHEVARRVKAMLQNFQVDKVGHGGTLDPNATGVLPLTLNQATRIQDVLLRARKEYVGAMHIHGDVDEDTIRTTLEGFQGQIWQMPPSRSAIKREMRARTIDFIEILNITARDVLFRVGCEAGTYIRTLAVDVGAALGCGGHLTKLRRTRSGSFSEEQGLTTMDNLEDATREWRETGSDELLLRIIRPVEAAFASFRPIVVVDAAVHAICRGATVQARDIAQLDPEIESREEVGIFTLKGEVVARGASLAAANDILQAKKGHMVRTRKVYMDPG